MNTDEAVLVHGVLIDPLEDSTPDNLRGLAELLDICRDPDLHSPLDARLRIAWAGPDTSPESRTALRLEATGDLVAVASAARTGAVAGIYPDVGVSSIKAGLRARQLLEGTIGVLVEPIEVLRLSRRLA